MPTDRIPLVGSFNQRGLTGNADLVANVDQRFLNCTFDIVQNPVTEKITLYVQRRPGWSMDSTMHPYALSLTGAAGTYASTPDSAALDITGDIEFIAYVAASDWTPSANQNIAAKWQAFGQLSYRYLLAAAGTLLIVTDSTGSGGGGGAVFSTASVPFANGDGGWIRVTFDVDDGAGNRVYKFYTSTDAASTPVGSVSWTQLGNTVTSVGTTSIYASTSILEIGSAVGGTSQTFDGQIHSVYLYNGLVANGGTLAAAFKASDYVPGIATITSSLTAEVYTLNGAAAINNNNAIGLGLPSTALIHPQSFNATLTAFGDTNSTIFFGASIVGIITGMALYFTETIVSGVSYVMIKSSDGTGWFYANGAKDNVAYTCDGNNSTTITDIKVGGVNSVAGLYVGQKLTAATNIAAGSRITSINSGAFSAVLDTATTGGAFNDLAVTKEPIAKIVSTNFVTTGTSISAFAEMDGYLFYTTDDGNIWNSDLNSVKNYTATSYVSPNMAPDPPVAIARSANMIIVLGSASKEVFYNAGLAVGSPLQRSAQYFERIGALDQRSVTTLENDIYFASTPYEGDLGIFRISGLNATRISTPAVDRIIGTAATGGAIYAASFRLGGYPYAAFVISTASDGPYSDLLLESGDIILQETGDLILLEDTPGQVASFVRMLVYNAFLKVWSEWDCNMVTFIDGIASGTANKLLSSSRFDPEGNVYSIDPTSNGDVWIDEPNTPNPDTYTMEIRTALIDHGTFKRKFVQGIRLVGDQQDAGDVDLYFSDDNYQTWNGPFTFHLNQPRPQVQRLGSYRGGRAYKLVHSYNGPCRLQAIEIDYTVEE